MALPAEAARVLHDLNPWWADPRQVRPAPPAWRRPAIAAIGDRLRGRSRLVELVRGPRQVGKTTGIYQIIEDLIAAGARGRDLLFVRYDLDVLREVDGGLVAIFRWFRSEVIGRDADRGPLPVLFLDEIHKLARWDEQVKHVFDTFTVKILLTGSSSVLVARGGRESLAGRTFGTELGTFSFRECLTAWHPALVEGWPPPQPFESVFDFDRLEAMRSFARSLYGQKRLALGRRLERYFTRGGYPRLHSGEVSDDLWADYLVQTIFENVLGADIPQLFPVQDPRLLRHLYLAVARSTGMEISQPSLVEDASAAGFKTSQPTVGRYLHYLADALLIREFRRYPLANKRSARVPVKITLSDLGVRNAIFRGAPSLWESDPGVLGPLVETLVQSVMKGPGLQVHFWRDYSVPKDRRSKTCEVDFVAERLDGAPLPIEVKFRRRIHAEDLLGVRSFLERFPDAPHGVVVTRDLSEWRSAERILCIPLLDFLLLF